MKPSKTQQVLELAVKTGLVHARTLRDSGLTRQALYRLRDRGVLQQVGPGLFRAPQVEPTQHQTLVEVCLRAPRGVVCLLSALRFHDIGTQLPPEVWLALPLGAWQPRIAEWGVRFLHFSGDAYATGIEHHTVGGADVRVYGVAKTVADCFKFRNQIGLDVAMEALREAGRAKACTVDEIWRCARVCRVQRVMLPYLEAMNG